MIFMAEKGNSRYMKRLNAPEYFGIHRKEHAYVTKPNPGRHTLEQVRSALAGCEQALTGEQ